MKKILMLMTALSVLVLAACSTQKTSSKNDVNIMTTFYPVYEMTKEIVGSEGKVDMLIKAGTEVHGFEPSAKDIAKIEDASSFIYMDDNMETWVSDLKKNLEKSHVEVVKATGDMLLLAGSEEDEHDHNHGEEHHHEYDPHVWVSPHRAILLVKNIQAQLSKTYPEKAATFEKNAQAYLKKLEAINTKYVDSLSQAQQKSFVTQHAAFNYLALDYGLKQVSVSGLSSETVPSAARLAELSDYIKEYDIKYIYFESTASSAVAETLAKETGVQTAVLNPLESLTDAEIKAGATYLSVMEDNLKALELTTKQAGTEIEPEDGNSTTQTVYNGYFEDSAVKDRTLSDYSGEWQSVYPYLLDGSLDEVFDYKSKKTGTMTAEEYKNYYDTGYKTDVSHIKITDKTMTFTVNGEQKTYTYEYKGYKILTYKKGNRGVRFLFEAKEADAGNYKYVQFSDHAIAPTKAGHFHIFFGGESQEKLLEEMDNWPTYYPADMTAHEIAQEMVLH